MLGLLKSLNASKGYGFITGETSKTDYFFHRDSFDGHWNDLEKDFENGDKIELEFEPTRTSKGLRAENVGRKDGIN